MTAEDRRNDFVWPVYGPVLRSFSTIGSLPGMGAGPLCRNVSWVVEAGPPVLLLVGPNGAGMTTSSQLVLPDGVVFVDADIVARQLAREGHPARGLDVAAGRIVVSKIRRLGAECASFCVKANLAGRVSSAPSPTGMRVATRSAWRSSP